jgi:hypothetical protein
LNVLFISRTEAELKFLVAAAALCLATPAFAHDAVVYVKPKACGHTMVEAEQYAKSQAEANPDLEFIRFSPADSKRILDWLNKQPPARSPAPRRHARRIDRQAG